MPRAALTFKGQHSFLGAALQPCKLFMYSFPWIDTLWGACHLAGSIHIT